MKNKSRIVSQLAVCHTCGIEWEDCINSRARKAAYYHAKKTGHTVLVETVTSIHYN